MASCCIAAGRRVSSEAISTRLPSRSFQRRASLAVVVVLPEPCRPTISTGAGGESILSAGAGAVAGEDADQLVVDDLDDLLAGGDRLGDGLAAGLVLHPLDEVAGDRQRDVGLEQGDADLAQRGRDVLVGQRALAGELVEDAGEPAAEGLEHGRTPPRITPIAPVGATR